MPCAPVIAGGGSGRIFGSQNVTARECLRATLRETVANPEEADEELRYLLSLFSRP